MIKLKPQKALACLLAAAITAAGVPDLFRTTADAAAAYVYYDFGEQTLVDGAVASSIQAGCDQVKNRLYDGYSLTVRTNNTSNMPTLTLDEKIDTDKYKYVKLCVSYAQAVGSTDMTTWIAFDGAEKTKLADIEASGNSLTDVNGNTYAKADFRAAARETKYITLTAQMNTAGGEKKITYCPAESTDNVKVYAAVKYMAFFETQQAADNFDQSLKGASYIMDGTSYDAEIDPFEHTAKITVPDGTVTSETIDFDKLTVSTYTAACTANRTTADSDGMYADYIVKGIDGKTRTWRVSVICRQMDDSYVSEMVAALNRMTSADANDVWNKYESAVSKLVDGYADFNSAYKPQLLAGLCEYAGTFTTANYKNIIADEMLYARIKNECAAYADFAVFAQNNGLKDKDWSNTFFTSLDDANRDIIYNGSITENSFAKFTESIWEKSVLKVFSLQESYGGIKKLVEANLKICGFTETEYQALMNIKERSEQAYRDIVGKTFSHAADIKPALTAAVAALKDKPVKEPDESRDLGSGTGEVIAANPSDITSIFKDIDGYGWAQADIKQLYEKKIISGRENGLFAPADGVTREEFVVMVQKAFGFKNFETADVFADVVPGSWYANSVYAAYNEGAVSGISDSTFGVGMQITREDIAAIAYRILNILECEYKKSDEPEFADKDDISEYAKEAVAVLSENGVINGADGSFLPKKNATRAETAVIIRRLMSLADGSEMDIKNDGENTQEGATAQMKALNALKIYSNGMMDKRREYVNRAAFAEIAANFAAVGSYGGTNSYSDLTDDEAGYARAAVENGLMDDGDSGKFNADRKVIREDVIRLLIKTIMNSADIAQFGGYTNAAKMLQLDVDFAEGEPVTYAMLANMLIDSMQNSMPIKTGSYTQSGEEYLQRKFDAKIMTGTVAATERTGLYGEKCAKGYVRIGSKEYKTDFELTEKLGLTIKFIEQKIDGDDVIIFVYDNYESYTEKIFSADDVESFDGSRYRVTQNNRQTDIRVSSDKILVYNGVVCDDYTNKTFNPDLGSVRLVDTDNNGDYDIIFVSEYKTIIVGSVDSKNEAIYDKNGAGSVSYKDADNIEVTNNGKTGYITELKNGTVLQVYESRDGKNIVINATDNSVQGKLTSIKEEDKVIFIDGTEYGYDVDYVNSYSGNLIIGQTANVLLNAEGKAVYLDFQTSEMKVGFLIDADVVDGDDGMETLMLKMFTADDARVRKLFTTGDKITIDNEKKTLAAALSVLKKNGGDVLSQPILYNDDAAGKVTKLDTAYNNKPKVVDPTPLINRKPGSSESETSYRMIYATEFDNTGTEMWAKTTGGYKTFGRNRIALLVKNAANVFVVPSDPKTADPDSFSLVTVSFFRDQAYTQQMEAYSYTASDTADILVYHEDVTDYSAKPKTEANIRVISDIKNTLNDDNELITTLTVYGLGYSSNTITIPDSENYEKVRSLSYNDEDSRYRLGVGDIIWYDLNAKNEVTNIRIVFDASETDPMKAFKAHHRADMPRRYNSVLETKLWFEDVYEVTSDGIALGVVTDLTDYDGDGSDLNFSYEALTGYAQQFVVHVDLTEKKPVITFNGAADTAKTTWKDIKDYKTYGNEFSRIIPITRAGYEEGLFIIDMPKESREERN